MSDVRWDSQYHVLHGLKDVWWGNFEPVGLLRVLCKLENKPCPYCREAKIKVRHLGTEKNMRHNITRDDDDILVRIEITFSPVHTLKLECLGCGAFGEDDIAHSMNFDQAKQRLLRELRKWHGKVMDELTREERGSRW